MVISGCPVSISFRKYRIIHNNTKERLWVGEKKEGKGKASFSAPLLSRGCGLENTRKKCTFTIKGN
jgi:hypothetical protein